MAAYAQMISVTTKRDDGPEYAITEFWRALMHRTRRERGMSQATLGGIVGVSQNVISKIESGEMGNSSSVAKISQALGIPVPHLPLIDETDERWLDAGRQLRQLDRELFDQQLLMLERLAAAVTKKMPKKH